MTRYTPPKRAERTRQQRLRDAVNLAKVVTAAGVTVLVTFPRDLTTEEHDWIESELDVHWVEGRLR